MYGKYNHGEPFNKENENVYKKMMKMIGFQLFPIIFKLLEPIVF